jgi:Flp pilus assembly protein TadG
MSGRVTSGRFLSRLARDAGGTVVMWVTAALGIFLAIGALMVDSGRVYNLHSQLQTYADHAALAAAAELAGDSGAINRAIEAATGALSGAGPIVTDTQNYATGAAALTIQTLTFLSALGSGMGHAGTVGGDDVVYTWTAGAAAPTANQSRAARFVQVSVAPRTVNYAIYPVVAALGFGGAVAATVDARATAGFTRTACRIPPLMICNPNEDPVTGGGDFDAESWLGRQIRLRTQGAGAQWAPGSFGLLDISGMEVSDECSGGGANLLRCVLGLVDSGLQCLPQGGTVNIQPGQAIAVNDGLNTRFDIWNPPLNRNDPAFAPARNVTKGFRHDNNRCTWQQHDPATTTVGLPRDDCFASGTCGGPDGEFGNGVSLNTLRNNYWAINHPGVAWPSIWDPTATPPGVQPTRYQIYRYEIANNIIPDGNIVNHNLYTHEHGHPTCATPVTEPANMPITRDRRTIVAAIVNCIEEGINGSASNVPTKDFALFFITEPIVAPPHLGGGEANDLFAEFLGVVRVNADDGILHELPILYR